jgi:hypothetical protein
MIIALNNTTPMVCGVSYVSLVRLPAVAVNTRWHVALRDQRQFTICQGLGIERSKRNHVGIRFSVAFENKRTREGSDGVPAASARSAKGCPTAAATRQSILASRQISPPHPRLSATRRGGATAAGPSVRGCPRCSLRQPSFIRDGRRLDGKRHRPAMPGCATVWTCWRSTSAPVRSRT